MLFSNMKISGRLGLGFGTLPVEKKPAATAAAAEEWEEF